MPQYTLSQFGDVTAVILAGGLGSRLRSAVSDRPKVLADVAGKPFLVHLLDRIQAYGMTQAVLCVGYLGEMVRETFGERYEDVRLSFSQESELLGTGGAVRLALPQVTTSTLLVMNGDSYCAADWNELLAFHRERQAEGTILAVSVPDVSRFGRLIIDEEGCLTRFVEKGCKPASGTINAGVYLLHRDIVAEIPPGEILSLEKDLFPKWAAARRLKGWKVESPFLDMGTPESYSQAETFLRMHNKPAKH